MKTRLEKEVIAKTLFQRLIRNEFDRYTQYWQRELAEDCIILAKFYAFHDLAEEMENDLI